MVDLAGGGLAESIAETNRSLTREHINLGEITLNYAVVGLDMLGVMANPVEALATSVISFIIEHLKPFRDVLDWTTGDPDGVQSAVERWNTIAADLHELGIDHRDSATKLAPTWRAGDTESFSNGDKVINFRADQIDGARMACIAMADLTASSGTWVAAARGIIRDIIAAYVWDQLKKAAVKLPFGLLTAGASVAEFFTNAMISLGKALRRIGKVLDALLEHLKSIAKGLQKTARDLHSFAKTLDKRIGLMTRTEGNVWFTRGTLVPNWGVLKGVVDFGREEAKANATERQASAEDARLVDNLHEQHDGNPVPKASAESETKKEDNTEHEAENEDNAETETEKDDSATVPQGPGLNQEPPPPYFFPPPGQPMPPEKPKQGPGLPHEQTHGARWTASGTLDDE